MSQDEMQALHSKLDAIHGALVGNPALGHKGIVARMDDLEGGHAKIHHRLDDTDRKMIRWGGIITGIGLAIELFKDKVLGGGS